MKKFVWPIILGLTLLVGCQNTDQKTKEEKQQTGKTEKQSAQVNSTAEFPYPNLLAENTQTYSLLAIGEQDESDPIEKNTKITEKVTDILSLPTLEMAQQAYPKLKIETNPAYLLFDKDGMVLQTKNLKDLTSFLDKNEQK